MAMVNMKMSATEAKEYGGEATMASDAPEYPYGLCIRLDDDALEKLGITALPAIGICSANQLSNCAPASSVQNAITSIFLFRALRRLSSIVLNSASVIAATLATATRCAASGR